MNKVETLNVALGTRSYPVHVGSGLLASALLLETIQSKRLAVVTNTTLKSLFADALCDRLREAGKEVCLIALPDGEEYKTHDTLNLIYDDLLESGLDRKSCLIALGGGVVGDMAGFAAATYQRGIPFIQIPTTLLAQVDSSVGGKTAINHRKGKNMIGAFHQPKAVFADTDTLSSLPERELKAGLAEVIKYGLIRDPSFFDWLEANMPRLLARDNLSLQHAVRESCRNKAEVVAADELESGERALLNLGHTFGHAIEGVLGFGTWLHGEAVSAGMVLAAELSVQLGRLDSADLERIRALLAAAGLPTDPPPVSAEEMLLYMDIDKKSEGGQIRLVLLGSLGSAYLDSKVPRSVLKDFLQARLSAAAAAAATN